jgi:AbrB family looped-hinge helix DNA binding protein
MIMTFDYNCDGEDGKHIFGVVKVGEKGQIVIPKEAREIFGIKPGDNLMVLGDERRGIALVKSDKFRSLAAKMLELFEEKPLGPDEGE